MKTSLLYLFSLALLLNTCSCKRLRYDQVRVHGRVINGCLGAPMPGEKVCLYSVKPGFLSPGTSTTIKTVTTNSNGEFDFGGVDLRKNDKYSYYVQYIHRGITMDGFCDFFEVKKNAIDQNQDLVVFVPAGIQYKIIPDLSVMGVNDSIHIEHTSATNFGLFYCNPHAATDYAHFSHIVVNNAFFAYSNPTPAIYAMNAYYFIKITKFKDGITTVTNDTVYVQNALLYQIPW